MTRRANAVVLVLVVLLVCGLVAAYIPRIRAAAAQQECKNNLRCTGLDCANYHSGYGFYPPGTVPNVDLPPERRLSWLVGGWGYFGDGQLELLIDRTQAWDEGDNRLAQYRCGLCDDSLKQSPLQSSVFVCPSNPTRELPGLPQPLHYVGVAGVGRDAAEWGPGYARAGIFGYDRRTRQEDITNGASSTMLLIETTRDNGPWTAGGPPTVRGLDPGAGPYLGAGGQFGAQHWGEGMSPFPAHVTNIAFADLSVRSVSDKTSPDIFEAMAVIRKEHLDPSDPE